MSQENVDRFLKGAEAFNRDDIEGGLEIYDPDVVFETQAAEMEGVFIGHEGVRGFIASIDDHYEDVQIEYPDVRDLGDRVLALGTMRTVGKGSGMTQETPLAIVASFRNGRITASKDYGDKDRALKAAGLSE